MAEAASAQEMNRAEPATRVPAAESVPAARQRTLNAPNPGAGGAAPAKTELAKTETKIQTNPAATAGATAETNADAKNGAKPQPGPTPAGRTPDRAARSGPGQRPERGRAGVVVFGAACAVLSLAGAAAALTAPTLRPMALTLAREWLGPNSAVATYLQAAPPPVAEPAAAPAPLAYPPPGFQAPGMPPGDTSLQAAALAAVRAELIGMVRLELDGVRRSLGEQADRVKAMGATVLGAQAAAMAGRAQAQAAEATAAGAAEDSARALAASARVQEASVHGFDALRERLDRLEADAAALDARVRATGLLAVAGQLRRDIDAGAPLRDDLTALPAARSLPAAVQRAVDELSRSERGVPTLRDLGLGYEALDEAIADRTAGVLSWFGLSGWIGVGANGQRDTLDRARALAVEGRFTEAADVLERSEWANLAQRWIAQVRLRAAAVTAGQTVMAHAQAVYEASQSMLSQATSGRTSP